MSAKPYLFFTAAASRIVFTVLLVFFAAVTARADAGSRLPATGGVSQIEGSGGGGIVPWATISGYGQQNEWGLTAYATALNLDDYEYASRGIALGYSDRVEVSFARQSLDISELGLPFDSLQTESLGLKVRIANNLIYDALPQFSVGLQHKRVRDFSLPALVGAVDDEETEFYFAATKLWLDGLGGYPLLLNTTLRWSSANQTGLLGFGGDKEADPSLLSELSLALLLKRNLAMGIEYRQKPNNLAFAEEEDWADIFLAWFPDKHFSVTVAWADLGSIAGLDGQRGIYLSLQGAL